jgi:hypothetical protein
VPLGASSSCAILDAEVDFVAFEGANNEIKEEMSLLYLQLLMMPS